MKLLQEKVAVITGVNSGIGRRTAELFAQQGAKIVGVDIRTDRMEDLKAKVEESAGTGELSESRRDVYRG